MRQKYKHRLFILPCYYYDFITFSVAEKADVIFENAISVHAKCILGCMNVLP